MRVKFANGTVKHCTAPTEQKVFRNNGGENAGAGWVLLIKLTGEVTSSEIDELMTADNIKKLDFFPEAEPETESGDGGETPMFTLAGYSKVTSSSIRYAEEKSAVTAEIQMSKGL